MEFGSELAIFLKVLLAMALGGAVGLERQLADKPAGLRTHMLVAGTATLFVLLGDIIVTQFGAVEDSGIISADPIRIFEAILVGVSFLGAGTIFKSERKQEIEGLTTAASLLFMAAVGVAVALQRVYLAIALTLLVLFVSWVLRVLERTLLHRREK